MSKEKKIKLSKEEILLENLLLDIMRELRSQRNLYKLISHNRPTYLLVVSDYFERRFTSTKFIEGNDEYGHNHGSLDSTKTTWGECVDLIGFQTKDDFYVYITNPVTFNRLVNDSHSVCESCIHRTEIESESYENWICPNPLSDEIIQLFKGHHYAVLFGANDNLK